MSPKKAVFLMILGTLGRFGAKWVPEGAERVHMGRQGYQKAQNMKPGGVEKELSGVPRWYVLQSLV